MTWAEALQPAMQHTNTWLSSDISAYEAANGSLAWEHYRTNRSVGSAYEDFQDRISQFIHIPELITAITLKPGEKFLDVACAKGALALALAESNPTTLGAVLDQPYMEQAFGQQLSKVSEDIAKRVHFVAGDMLENIPSGFDTYLIKHALRDWNDAQAGAISRNIAAAMQPSARLLIIEGIKRPQHQDHVLMQTRAYEQAIWSVGKLRTLEEFTQLLTTAGLTLLNIRDTGIFYLSILECSRLP